MRFSESLSNITAALAKVQAEIKNPIKNQTNKGVMGAPKYANLEDTLQDYVRPVLSKYGMSVFQSVTSDEQGKVGVCTVLFHESGEFIEGDYVFCETRIPTNRDGKEVLTPGQAAGVVITYLRRYSLNSALGITGDKDTDGSFSDEPVQESQPRQKRAPMTYEAARAYKVKFGVHNGKTLEEVYKEDRAAIPNLYNDPAADAGLKEAIGIIQDKIAEARKAKGAE